MPYPFKINGYIYSKRTKEGFLRMQRHGYPRPLFSIQDELAKTLGGKYKAIVRKLMADLKGKLQGRDVTLDDDGGLESLLRFFEEMGKKAAEASKRVLDKARAAEIARELEREWNVQDQEEIDSLDNLYEGEIGDDFRPVLERTLKKEQKDFINKILIDGGDAFKMRIEGFSIDKKKFFEDNMAELRRLYIDDSMKRVAGETNYIKRKILERLNAWATNQADELKLDDLTAMAYRNGDNLSRLFARDQMQRFNKACALSTFGAAGVTKVKWMTANDGRVRSKDVIDKNGVYHRAHTRLNGMVFSVDELPIEIDDYNCRCALVPVEWAD